MGKIEILTPSNQETEIIYFPDNPYKKDILLQTNLALMCGSTHLQKIPFNFRNVRTSKRDDPFIFHLPKKSKYLLQMHITENAENYKNLQPIERIKKIRLDIAALLYTLTHNHPDALIDQQIKRFRNIPIIGLSPLAKLLRNKEGIYTFPINIETMEDKELAYETKKTSTIFGGEPYNINDRKMYGFIILPQDLAKVKI